MARSFIATAHFDLSLGFAFHPMGPLLLLLVAFQIPLRIFALCTSRRMFPMMGERLASLPFEILALCLVVVGLWRAGLALFQAMGIIARYHPPTTWADSAAIVLVSAILWFVVRVMRRRPATG
jgi:hypothetical protein